MLFPYLLQWLNTLLFTVPQSREPDLKINISLIIAGYYSKNLNLVQPKYAKRFEKSEWQKSSNRWKNKTKQNKNKAIGKNKINNLSHKNKNERQEGKTKKQQRNISNIKKGEDLEDEALRGKFNSIVTDVIWRTPKSSMVVNFDIH